MNQEIAKKAARWWADQLRHPPTFDNGTGGQIEEFALAAKDKGLTLGLPTNGDLTAQQIKKFEEALFNSILLKEFLVLAVDYHPEPILEDALIRAGIQPDYRLPIKTAMWVHKGQVRKGYTGKEVSFL